LESVLKQFGDAELRRPRTCQGAVEGLEAGFGPMYERAIDRLIYCSLAERWRLEYHAVSDLECPGELTPHALDDLLEVASPADGELLVQLTDTAPAATDIDDPAYGDRVCAERIERYTVPVTARFARSSTSRISGSRGSRR
jgi:hypothetical protein